MATAVINIEELRERLIEKLKDTGWALKLRGFIYSTEFTKLLQTLWNLREDGKRFTPPLKYVFRAFEECSLNNLKVVFIGQDSYPWLGVADGLAFSCSLLEKTQPSLKYILDAVQKTVYPDQSYDYNKDLTHWANQGVLLINSALTCEMNTPGTHYQIWQPFLSYLIDMLNNTHPGLIWVLIGKKAQEFSDLIDPDRHHIITAVHPAFSARNNVEWECNDMFNQINEIIEASNGPEFRIRW